jgi:hypothetical protein
MLIETIGLIEIHVEAEEEDIPVGIDSGDEVYDKTVEDRILRRLHNGDEWAWCCAKVSARIVGTDIKESTYLGCSSYRNAQDFVKNSGYYPEMKNECLEAVLEQVRHLGSIQDVIEQEIAATRQKMRDEYEVQRQEIESARTANN